MAEKRKLRILVLSEPAWAEENNTGNTLSNFFTGFPAEFANIYFRPGKPNNRLCHRYFQVTDYMVLEHLLKRKPVGITWEDDENAVETEDYEINESTSESFDQKARKHNSFYGMLMRELAWKLTTVDNKAMYSFIADFQPDVIYAPVYGNLRMTRIFSRIQERTGLPMVSLISDDHYFPEPVKRTPLRLWYHYALQKSLKKMFLHIDYFLTMTQEQADAYEPLYGKPLDVIKKSAVIPYRAHVKHDVLRLIYGGGIYFGREETLIQVTAAVKELNAHGHRYELHIFSGSNVTTEHLSVLNDRVNSFFEGKISYPELLKEYQNSDIAVHAEGFDVESIEQVKLSFSTKIIDCLQSGAPVLCIADESSAGARYLEREHSAVIVHDPSQIAEGIQEIDSHYDYWQKRAFECLEKNHSHEHNLEHLSAIFDSLMQEKSCHENSSDQ